MHIRNKLKMVKSKRDAARVTEVIIRNRYKGLKIALDL
jgi:transcription initiation factor TFIIIB Brf1 subunit/transcription initiation factor TFIIB